MQTTAQPHKVYEQFEHTLGYTILYVSVHIYTTTCVLLYKRKVSKLNIKIRRRTKG